MSTDEAREAARRVIHSRFRTSRPPVASSFIDAIFDAGVAEGIRLARDEVRMLPCYGTRETGFEFDDVTRDDVLAVIDALKVPE